MCADLQAMSLLQGGGGSKKGGGGGRRGGAGGSKAPAPGMWCWRAMPAGALVSSAYVHARLVPAISRASSVNSTLHSTCTLLCRLHQGQAGGGSSGGGRNRAGAETEQDSSALDSGQELGQGERRCSGARSVGALLLSGTAAVNIGTCVRTLFLAHWHTPCCAAHASKCVYTSLCYAGLGCRWRPSRTRRPASPRPRRGSGQGQRRQQKRRRQRRGEGCMRWRRRSGRQLSN